VPEVFENYCRPGGQLSLRYALCGLEETVSIQLTEEQALAVAASGQVPPILVDPTTQTDYVLIRKDVYEHLTREEYDDSPWTAEERDALAWEAGKHAGWEEMSEYDDVEQP
jgi:hypothetical protein